MKAIILCAGEGKRLRPIVTPKCLLKYKDETILQRLIRQLRKYGVNEIFAIVGYQKDLVVDNVKGSNVEIIYDDRKHPDASIYSVFLAMEKITPDDLVIFDADIVVENEFIKYVVGTDFENKSVFFTRGKFKPEQNGGILKTDSYGNITDIKVVDKYSPDYQNYDKTTGVIRIAKKHFQTCFRLISNNRRKDSYYFMCYVGKFPFEKGDASFYSYRDFNTYEEYKKLKKIIFDYPLEIRDVYLTKIANLLPIEGCDSRRISLVKEGIINNGSWIMPLKIEKKHNLVLDGHHSLQLAKNMGLTFVPVVSFDYDEVDMWSLRENLKITKNDVIKNARLGYIYPCKTVKHRFPNVTFNCNISLEELK